MSRCVECNSKNECEEWCGVSKEELQDAINQLKEENKNLENVLAESLKALTIAMETIGKINEIHNVNMIHAYSGKALEKYEKDNK